MKPKRPNSAVFEVEKPPDFSDEDWFRLTPREKVMYATNPGLYRPGESGQKPAQRHSKGPKRASKPVGRPRKDGLPPIQSGQRAVILGQEPRQDQDASVPSVVQEPAFVVEPADTVKEALEVNGLSLVQDAYRRAARANSSGDPFDRAVYLTLLGKAHPMASLGDGKPIPIKAKRTMRALTRFLAEHDAPDADFNNVESP